MSTAATAIREIKGKWPPNVATIAKFFNIAGRPIFFSYSPNIYNPKNAVLTGALLAHETMHIGQQQSYIGGPESWWMRYCLDPVFRLGEEIAGHGEEMMHRLLTEAGANTNKQAAIVRETADRLRDKLYGWKMSRNKAADLLMQYGSMKEDRERIQMPAQAIQ